MAMLDFVLQDLTKKEPSEFQIKILNHVKALTDMSRRQMQIHYDAWDRQDDVYRGVRSPDKEDRRAEEIGAPVKMVVPLSYSQIQTFIAFCSALYGQRKTMFELGGNNMTGHVAAKLGEAVLNRDLNHNIFPQILYQFLLDIGRFGIGIIKHTWVKEKGEVWREETIPGLSFLGFNVGKPKKQMNKVMATKFMGNKLMVVSPFRFFPDVRLPISRFQDGGFCASEDEYVYQDLQRMQKDGLIAGVEHIPSMTEAQFTEFRRQRFKNFVYATGVGTLAYDIKSSVIVTEVQVDLVPKDFKIDGKSIGEEDYPIKYVVWYANDRRVVKCEPMGYLHNQFTYDVAQYSPDQAKLVNESISDMIDRLQDTISWFINSHITSVRKTISNQFIVDPQGIELRDFSERKVVIRLKPSAARSGVDKWIKQLQVQDVTGNHVADAEILHKLMQTVTGISENALGQFHSGRRSATEARAVNLGSANRLKLVAKLIYDTALEPLARKMLSNLRDGLDEPTYVKLVGDVPKGIEAYNGFAQVDKSMLMGEFDFDVFDGTLPSEKSALAQTLQDILLAMLQNPEAAPLFNLDPRKIFYEMVCLRGLKNIERFYPDQPVQPQPPANPTGLPTTGPLNGNVNGRGTSLQPATNGAGIDLSGLIG